MGNNKILLIGSALMLLQGCGNNQKATNSDILNSINSTSQEVELIFHPQVPKTFEEQKKDYYQEVLNYIRENENVKQNKTTLNSQIEMFSIDLIYSNKYSELSKYIFSKYGNDLNYTNFFLKEFGVLLNKHFLGKIKEEVVFEKQKVKEKLLFDFDISNVKIYDMEIQEQFSERGFGATILGNDIYIVNANSLSKEEIELVILHEMGHIYLERELGFLPDGLAILENQYIMKGSIHEFIADSFGIVLGKNYIKHLLISMYTGGDDTYNYGLYFFKKSFEEILSRKGVNLSSEFSKVKDKKIEFQEFVSYILSFITDGNCKEIQQKYETKSKELIEFIKSQDKIKPKNHQK